MNKARRNNTCCYDEFNKLQLISSEMLSERCRSYSFNQIYGRSMEAVEMTKLKFERFGILFILLSFVGSNFGLDQVSLEDFDTSKVMVSFNPYVSVLDKYNRSRYRPGDLVPMIEKIATRFNKIHIELSLASIIHEKSLVESLSAVALYNCRSTTKNKIEVFLQLGQSRSRRTAGFHYPISLADKANKACMGTVVYIILQLGTNFDITSRYLKNLKIHLNKKSSFNYSFGFSMDAIDYCNLVLKYHDLNVDVLLLDYDINDQLLQRNSNITCDPHNVTRSFKKPFKLIISSSPPCIETELVVNMTRSVTFWRHFLTLPSDMYLISFAFDCYPEGNEYSSKGWWYLLKDPGNANTTEYVFEEKLSVARKCDLEENPKNFKWLEQNQKFVENNTGIVSIHKDPFKSLVEFSQFCRVMNLYEKEAFWYSGINSKGFKRLGYLKTCLNFSVYHFTIFKKEENVSFRTLEERLSHLYKSGPIKISVYTLGDTLKTHYGYAYPLRMCGQYSRTSEDSDKFSKKINEPIVEVVVFYFYEDEDSVRLGATTLVRQRIVLFEKCKNLVNSERNISVEIAFVSIGYLRVDTFSVSPLAMQNYVKYTYLLENWSTNQTNIVVFLGQFQDEEISLQHGYIKQVVGWMSYYPSTDSYISKREEALKLSRLHYPKPVYNITEIVKTVNANRSAEETFLTRSQGFISVSISFAVGLVVIAVAAFLVRRYYNNNNITSADLAMFLNGDNQSDYNVNKIPYDREKYEIVEKRFKIESDVPLGAGEFGAVYRGIIAQSTGSIQVAVKTSKTQKLHKTQLTGLLSEIKILAYIGKHANITELLGANTSSLKNGKVYIFLEFCHLGSLQKYLQEIRVLVSSPIQETNVDAVTHGNIYTNASALRETTLDDALSNDLYRWSTEICNGMAFLAEKHVVHADLATRNVLLNLRREAKICDFGLSRRMYNYTNYVKTQQEPLPWKWMAPESLNDMQFNEKTDVWAYGVTLWEIYSLAKNPYAGLSWDTNFSQMLERGLRLSEPEYCEGDMYERMQECWNVNPAIRPTFSEMLLALQSSDGNQVSK